VADKSTEGCSAREILGLAGPDQVDRPTGAATIGFAAASVQAVDFEFVPRPKRDEVAVVLVLDQEARKILLRHIGRAPVDRDEAHVEPRENGSQHPH
jgi:hypothetical protein